MNFKWSILSDVKKDLIDSFDCGESTFNIFLKETAEKWQMEGECVTYVCLDDSEDPDRIYAYASINTLGLPYKSSEGKECLNCAEIRMFAISRMLRKNRDSTNTWSEQIFKSFLQELYIISVTVIGFDAIFLYSNSQGLKLYKNCGFSEVKDYECPDDEKIDVEGCTPLVLIMDSSSIDNMYM